MTLSLLPSTGSAQQGSPPIVAFVTPEQSPATLRYFEAVRHGLLEMGLIEHSTVAVEHHHFERRFERLPDTVADAVRRKVAVICTITNAVALSVKAATSDIPIVFAFGLDPAAMGLVKAFDRPEGNATGIYFPVTALDPKRLELLRELFPNDLARACTGA
jgi:putative ABC transport system substrate-binding protein